MKRLNPITNEPFKRGATREDGLIFYAYTKVVKSDGHFKEIWLRVNSLMGIKEKDKTVKKQKYTKKSDRHLPGYSSLTMAQKGVVNMLRRINEDGDWPEEEIVSELIGYELDAGPLLEEAIRHAGDLHFDAKEMFRRSLEE
jgi:hypothetical protein